MVVVVAALAEYIRREPQDASDLESSFFHVTLNIAKCLISKCCIYTLLFQSDEIPSQSCLTTWLPCQMPTSLTTSITEPSPSFQEYITQSGVSRLRGTAGLFLIWCRNDWGEGGSPNGDIRKWFQLDKRIKLSGYFADVIHVIPLSGERSYKLGANLPSSPASHSLTLQTTDAILPAASAIQQGVIHIRRPKLLRDFRPPSPSSLSWSSNLSVQSFAYGAILKWCLNYSTQFSGFWTPSPPCLHFSQT